VQNRKVPDHTKKLLGPALQLSLLQCVYLLFQNQDGMLLISSQEMVEVMLFFCALALSELLNSCVKCGM